MLPASMHAMAVGAAARRLRRVQQPVPTPGPGEVLVRVRTHVQAFALADANEAVDAVRAGRLEGAAVLVP